MEQKNKDSINVSIIIPTYNRAKIVGNIIASLAKQTYPAQRYEVILVDDGSTDSTDKILTSISSPLHFRYFKKKRAGPASARNYGVKKAQGEIIIFIDSDILVEQDFVQAHVSSHENQDKLVVKGVVINTERMDNLAREKMKLTDVSAAFFATGNVSIRKKYLLKAGLFDEDFKEYGWEDLELGVRLKKEGLRVVTNKNAVGYHYRKKVTLAHLPPLCHKEKMRGRTAVIFYRKHPTLEVKLMTHISLFFFALDRMFNFFGWMSEKKRNNLVLQLKERNFPLLKNALIKMFTSHCYMEGLREAIKEEKFN
ncbi:glycosyltransferase [Candidatus Aerophobetes bacterium]|nr:glycosyltransferase [Candidatus Aerophobetes bacterium]